ncbi:hypothetical protein JHK82_036939 [Glycine max]|nr:hypothetical protein JHK86_037144 [Glycine max]KAG5113670.1 hypothetical protein JHK82_036939 [Glycine max]
MQGNADSFGGNLNTLSRFSYFDHQNDSTEVPCGFLNNFPISDCDRIAMEKCGSVVVVSETIVTLKGLEHQGLGSINSREYKIDMGYTMEEAMASARWKKLLDVNALKEQMETYCENGLQPWSPNKQPYASDVPDSALILRRHGLGSNLFSCLIFNELEAFNPRDQLPFAFVRDHMEPNLKLNMFEVEVFEQVAVEYRHNLKSSDGTIVKKLSSSGRTKRAHPDLLYVNGKHHREEAEIYEGEALCMQKSRLLLDEILLPRGLLPLENIVEMGYNRPTGFVWLKQRNKKEHRFATIGRTVSYETEVTAFVEEHRMRVKTKELFKFDLYLNQIL